MPESFSSRKIIHNVDAFLQHLDRTDKPIIFTNGCFDILHAGHVSLLRQAANACDRLIVALNTDASVSGLKGPDRPVQAEAVRAAVMAADQTGAQAHEDQPAWRKSGGDPL